MVSFVTFVKKSKNMRKEYKYFEGKTSKNCEDRRSHPDPK